jgi:hypothetical protein
MKNNPHRTFENPPDEQKKIINKTLTDNTKSLDINETNNIIRQALGPNAERQGNR